MTVPNQCATAAVPRKPLAREVVAKPRVVAVTRTLRQAVREQLVGLYATGDPRVYREVVAKRLGISVIQVDQIMLGLLIENERRAACLDVGIENARAMANEAARAVWEEAAA